MTDSGLLHAPARHELTLPRYNFPLYEGRPKLIYVVASTPRSGSSLLCHLLWRTGALGAPFEYFNPWTSLFEMSLRLGARTFREYMTRLFQHRVSPNGVFGTKIHWSHVQFIATVNAWDQLGGARFIHITRRDHLAQAVSWELASQSEAWGANPEGTAPKYGFGRIQKRLRMIETGERGWRGSFKKSKIQPIEVCYEDLAADKEGTVSAIVKALGVSTDGAVPVDLSVPERQSGDVNADWIQRFKDARAAAEPSGVRTPVVGSTG